MRVHAPRRPKRRRRFMISPRNSPNRRNISLSRTCPVVAREATMARSFSWLPRRRDGGFGDVDRELAVAILEGFGFDLLELDRAAHHAGLPGLVLGIVLEFRHHLFGKQLERLADMFVAVLASLIQQDHLVDMRAPEPPQLLADGFG